MRKSRSLLSWLKADWILLAGLALLVVFTAGLAREIVRRKAVGQEIADLQRQVQELRNRRAALLGLVAEFQSTVAQEREARTKLNLGQPGEKAVIIERPSGNVAANVSAEAGSASSIPGQSEPNPHKWWKYFFDT